MTRALNKNETGLPCVNHFHKFFCMANLNVFIIGKLPVVSSVRVPHLRLYQAWEWLNMHS